MAPEMEALLRKHIQDGRAGDEKALERTKRTASLNSRLIFLNGAGQLPKRGLKELSKTVEEEIKEVIDG